jgi:crotonobetainyl-CoA:carnitine CoA-transferase CaiB-like acyl-CoA transferase
VTGEPLSGLRVVEMCRSAGGLAAGAVLAGLGAEVTKVRASGRSVAVDDPVLVWADRRKHTTDLDPDNPPDLTALRRYIGDADIFIADPPPGNLEARGLDAVTFSERAPALVHVWLPAFGEAGRWSQLHYDPLLVSAVSGYADHFPTEKDRPIASVVPTFAYIHGAMGAAAAVAGLLGRRKGGQGRSVMVSGLHAVGAALATLMGGGIDVDRVISAGRSPRAGPFFRLYQGSDGRWFYLAALSPALFIKALDAVGRMDIMVRDDVAGEFSNLILPAVGLATSMEMERTFAGGPAAKWLQLLQAAGVPAAAVWDRDRWAASDMAEQIIGWTDFDDPLVGQVRTPAFPLSIDLEPVASSQSKTGVEAVGDGLASSTQANERTTSTSLPGLPLDGLKIVDTSTFLAAPFASALLADWGAEVVKVEPVAGDPYRSHGISHAVANQHKRGIALDLKDPAARAAFLQLVRTCDVLVDNARGDRFDRIGLDQITLAGCNPSLVRCSVSAFGTQAPWADLPGFDPILQSMTGLAAAQGGDGPPAPSSAPVVDVGTGVLAALGILAALHARAADGRARHVRTSLAAGAVFVQSAEFTSYASRPPAARGGSDFLGPDAFVRFYRARDGWLGVAARTDAIQSAMGEVCGLDASDVSELADIFGTADSVDWVDRLSSAGVPAAVVRKRDGAIRDRYLRANGLTDQISIPDLGRFDVVGHYGRWEGLPAPRGRGYRLGEHTVSELRSAGLSDESVTDLVRRGKAVAPSVE